MNRNTPHAKRIYVTPQDRQGQKLVLFIIGAICFCLGATGHVDLAIGALFLFGAGYFVGSGSNNG